MCGIVGYVGKSEAVPVLLEGLRRLEYRGYDSAGVAVRGRDLTVRKCLGRLSALEASLEEKPAPGSLGIAHTRWATHGEPSVINSHPHTSASGAVAVVHNGIVENYLELREALGRDGYAFYSETDTEVVPNLIEKALADGAPDFPAALREALGRARGAYALGIVHRDQPETLYAARLGSPLVIGLGDGENYIASDAQAVRPYTDRVIYLEDGQVAALHRDRIEVWNLDGQAVEPEIVTVTTAADAAERAGFETFMLKEIHEQPRVLRGLLDRHLAADGAVALRDMALDADSWMGFERAIFIACGTAYHAALYGRLLWEALSSLPVECELGSEFRYRRPAVQPGTLVVAVSQSGETADTLASIRMAREQGCRVLSLCNVQGSSLVRDSDAMFYTDAGPEIGVASTKAYTSQLLGFALMGLHLARLRGDLTEDGQRKVARQLQDVARRHSLRAGPQRDHPGHRRQAPRRTQLAVPGSPLQLSHRPGGGAQEQGDLLPARRRLRRGRDEARPDRPHQRVHAGGLRVHPDRGRGVREDDFQRARGRSAARPDHRPGHRRGPCPGRRGRRRDLRSARTRRCFPPWSTWSPSSSWPTTRPRPGARTSTSRATWPRA